MAQTAQVKFNYARAIVTFILAYIAVTVLAIALSVGIGIVKHLPPSPEPMQNAAYLLSERFLPLMNLLAWTAFSWIYFRKQTRSLVTSGEAVSLGAFWLALAVLVDYVGFVLIKNPISLSPRDFYVGQFPWIYLIYIAVFFSPLCYAGLMGRSAKRSLT
jgi:SNF family Na+-dependent transporter